MCTVCCIGNNFGDNYNPVSHSSYTILVVFACRVAYMLRNMALPVQMTRVEYVSERVPCNIKGKSVIVCTKHYFKEKCHEGRT